MFDAEKELESPNVGNFASEECLTIFFEKFFLDKENNEKYRDLRIGMPCPKVCRIWMSSKVWIRTEVPQGIGATVFHSGMLFS